MSFLDHFRNRSQVESAVPETKGSLEEKAARSTLKRKLVDLVREQPATPGNIHENWKQARALFTESVSINAGIPDGAMSFTGAYKAANVRFFWPVKMAGVERTMPWLRLDNGNLQDFIELAEKFRDQKIAVRIDAAPEFFR